MPKTFGLASLDKQAERILNEEDAADFPLLWFSLSKFRTELGKENIIGFLGLWVFEFLPDEDPG